MEPKDMAHPFQVQLTYLNSLFSQADYDVVQALTTRINSFDFTAGEIIYHGINALYRAAQLLDDPSRDFHSIDIPRHPQKLPHDELSCLYETAIDLFISQLQRFSLEELDQEIISPLNGNPIILHKWIGTNTWHTIHHIGQGIRLAGIVGRRMDGNDISIEVAPNYRQLY